MGRRKQKHSADEATIQTRVAQFETKTHEIALALDKEWKGVQVNLDSNAKDLFPKLQPSTQQYLAIAQAISGRISRFIDKLAKSPWKMRTENLVHHFGAGIFLSYDFFTELYGFASAAEKKDLSWEEAWSALEHARIRRKENVDKRQRVSLQDDWTPSDVRDAMKAKGLLSKQLPQPTITNSATTEQQRVTSTSSCNTRHEQGSPPPSASYKSAPQESGLPPNTSPQPQPYLSVTGASPARGRTPSVPPSTPIYRQHSPFYKVEAESSLKRRSASSNCDASPRKQRKLTTTSESCEVEKKDPRDIDLKEGTGPEQNNSSPTIEAGRPGDHDLAIDQNSDDLQLGVSFNIDSDDNVDGHGSKYAKGKSRLLSESLEDHGSFVDDPGTAYDTPSPSGLDEPTLESSSNPVCRHEKVPDIYQCFEQNRQLTASIEKQLQQGNWLGYDTMSTVLSMFRTIRHRTVDMDFNVSNWENWAHNHSYTFTQRQTQAIIPVLRQSHWYLISVERESVGSETSGGREFRVRVFNSLAAIQDVEVQRIANALVQALRLTSGDTREDPVPVHHVKEMAQQRNSYDCGMYVILTSLYLFAGLPLPTSDVYAESASLWRQLLSCEICHNPQSKEKLASFFTTSIASNIPKDVEQMENDEFLKSLPLVTYVNHISSARNAIAESKKRHGALTEAVGLLAIMCGIHEDNLATLKSEAEKMESEFAHRTSLSTYLSTLAKKAYGEHYQPLELAAADSSYLATNSARTQALTKLLKQNRREAQQCTMRKNTVHRI